MTKKSYRFTICGKQWRWLYREALHAIQGFASEEHTEEVATTLANILWSLGYRRQDGDIRSEG